MKKIIAVLLALVMIISFAGCSSSSTQTYGKTGIPAFSNVISDNLYQIRDTRTPKTIEKPTRSQVRQMEGYFDLGLDEKGIIYVFQQYVKDTADSDKAELHKLVDKYVKNYFYELYEHSDGSDLWTITKGSTKFTINVDAALGRWFVNFSGINE